MSEIILKNISKIYTNTDKNFYALQDISLQFPTNQTTMIVGKSGCGKSTLLNIINGLSSMSAGTITIPEHISMAMVFQESRLLPWLTVEENCKFWNPKSNPLPLLEEFELITFKNYYPHEISGGMAQKTSLIRALLYQANFLLLDEPFASLDYFTRLYLQEKLKQVVSSHNLGMIFITHNIDKAIALGDKIVILDQGVIAKILENPILKRDDPLYQLHLKNKILQIINQSNT